MIKRMLYAMSIIFVSFGVFANEQLDRMEAYGEELATLMHQAMIRSVEAEGKDASQLKKLIPDSSWDDDMRDATRCILGKYEEKIDSDGVDKMLDEMESLLPKLRTGGMEVFEQVSDAQPDGITDEEAIEINRACGMIELQQKNMGESEFMTELMKLMASG